MANNSTLEKSKVLFNLLHSAYRKMNTKWFYKEKMIKCLEFLSGIC